MWCFLSWLDAFELPWEAGMVGRPGEVATNSLSWRCPMHAASRPPPPPRLSMGCRWLQQLQDLALHDSHRNQKLMASRVFAVRLVATKVM